MPRKKIDTTSKDDAGKLRYDLIPPEHVEGLAKIFTMGAAKYEDNGWIKGLLSGNLKFEQLYGAVERHIQARRKGELLDDESGYPHLYHAAWEVLAMAYYDELVARGDIDGSPNSG